VAPYVRARVWHASQRIEEQTDGRLCLTLDVCHDWGLRSWILSWGPFARVLAPDRLAHDIRTDLDTARERYTADPDTEGTGSS
jgi:predicted DNA-binding transcriptional regulator YafY